MQYYNHIVMTSHWNILQLYCDIETTDTRCFQYIQPKHDGVTCKWRISPRRMVVELLARSCSKLRFYPQLRCYYLSIAFFFFSTFFNCCWLSFKAQWMVSGGRGGLGVRVEEDPRPGIDIVTIHLHLMVAGDARDAARKASLVIIIHVVRQDANTFVFQVAV